VFSETEEKEIEVLTKLKETVDKQREEIRKYSREIKQKNVDVEAVSTKLCTFTCHDGILKKDAW